MSEGHALFLQALHFRFHEKFEEAGLALQAAASAGSGDACWHLYRNQEFYGYYYLASPSVGDTETFLNMGVELGHLMCVTERFVLDLDDHDLEDLIYDPNWKLRFPLPLDLQAEILAGVSLSGVSDNLVHEFSVSELNSLREQAQQALRIHDPFPVYCYIEYVTENQPKLFKWEDPAMIGEALFLLRGDSAFNPQYRVNFTYMDFSTDNIIDRNHFGLPMHTLSIIQCVIGGLACRYNHDGDEEEEYRLFQDCVVVYQSYKQKAQSAAVAWLGCFQRRALPHLSRDTARLIGQMIAPAVQWARLDHLNPLSETNKKIKI